MDRTQDIKFNVTGQSLIWDCPEGRPSAVDSVAVFPIGTSDDGTEEAATTGVASIDSVNTTVDTASGQGEANPRKLWVTSAANMATGRQYLVTGVDGAKEWVEVVEVDDAGEFVIVRYPMANAFAVGSTVVGTRISISVDSTWVADSANLSGGTDPTPGYRVRWVYTVAGAQHVHDGYFDLVRYVGGHTVTLADVDREFPGLSAMGPGFHRADGFRGLLDQAYERVRWDLVAFNLDDNAVRDQDALNRATVLAVAVLVARARVNQGGDRALLELAERDYDTFMTRVFQVGAKAAVDEGSGGGADRMRPEPFWEK